MCWPQWPPTGMLEKWDGFGLAVQAYGKRAIAAIDWVPPRWQARWTGGSWCGWSKGLTGTPRSSARRNAGWPIIRCSRARPMTDLNYMACAERLLAQRPRIYPQFATHNALTVASVIERAGGVEGYEFQRLHGMGDALYGALLERHAGVAVRTYAPVGIHRDLLAYLVRRLLENGANSSFVSISADAAVPVDVLLRRPGDIVGSAAAGAACGVAVAGGAVWQGAAQFGGLEFGHAATLDGVAGGDRARHFGGGKRRP